MYQDSGKKIVILYILKILWDHTDANHTMTQQQIADKLLSEYGIEVNRATIKRNLSDLMEAGYSREVCVADHRFLREACEVYGAGGRDRQLPHEGQRNSNAALGCRTCRDCEGDFAAGTGGGDPGRGPEGSGDV